MATVTRINGSKTVVGTLYDVNSNLYKIVVKDTTNTVVNLTKEDSVGTSAPVITAGSFVVGKLYDIVALGNTDFTQVGAVVSAIGVKFIATGVGVGSGTAAKLGTTIEAIVDEISPLAYFTTADSSGIINVIMDKSIDDAAELQVRIRRIGLLPSGLTDIGPNDIDISGTIVTKATTLSLT